MKRKKYVLVDGGGVYGHNHGWSTRVMCRRQAMDSREYYMWCDSISAMESCSKC
jgi:hypothetical protein